MLNYPLSDQRFVGLIVALIMTSQTSSATVRRLKMPSDGCTDLCIHSAHEKESSDGPPAVAGEGSNYEQCILFASLLEIAFLSLKLSLWIFTVFAKLLKLYWSRFFLFFSPANDIANVSYARLQIKQTRGYQSPPLEPYQFVDRASCPFKTLLNKTPKHYGPRRAF